MNSVGWSNSPSVWHTFLNEGGKLHFHARIGALVNIHITKYDNIIITISIPKNSFCLDCFECAVQEGAAVPQYQTHDVDSCENKKLTRLRRGAPERIMCYKPQHSSTSDHKYEVLVYCMTVLCH